ncbi:hypothetical protein [Leptospira sp. GIMC2001]|uniref:hypothetical protein n=1 Tax=Leptospira sp. GIMC2001 TaxID=1513297 RepID=UPI00234B6743|nr:hypothetical protein [Leptospira sp. GIMC2001]WCL48161.1 hypothetical protein O4O04_12670 [Leptospira sp. GIMC2001]
MQISGYNQAQTNASNMIERIANLPKEIFQAQMDTSEKLMKLAVQQNIQAQTGKERLLDTIA